MRLGRRERRWWTWGWTLRSVVSSREPLFGKTVFLLENGLHVRVRIAQLFRERPEALAQAFLPQPANRVVDRALGGARLESRRRRPRAAAAGALRPRRAGPRALRPAPSGPRRPPRAAPRSARAAGPRARARAPRRAKPGRRDRDDRPGCARVAGSCGLRVGSVAHGNRHRVARVLAAARRADRRLDVAHLGAHREREPLGEAGSLDAGRDLREQRRHRGHRVGLLGRRGAAARDRAVDREVERRGRAVDPLARSASAPSRASRSSGSQPAGSSAARTRRPAGRSTSSERSIARWPASSPSNSSTTLRVRRRRLRAWPSVSACRRWRAPRRRRRARARSGRNSPRPPPRGRRGGSPRAPRTGRRTPRACGRSGSRACSGTSAPVPHSSARPPKPMMRPRASRIGNVSRPRSRS